MTITLPTNIAAYFEADRQHSPEAVAAAFTETGQVKDKGRIHQGHNAIRDWMASEGKAYSYTVTPFRIESRNGKTEVIGHTVGNFPGSPIDLRFLFVMAEDGIVELEITV